MPNQEHDRFILSRQSKDAYRSVSMPEQYYNEAEGLRRSLGRVLVRPAGEIFRVPSARVMAQAYSRAGDMRTLREVVMQSANFLDEHPDQKPGDVLSSQAYLKLKQRESENTPHIVVESSPYKWVEELSFTQDPNSQMK